MKVKNERYLFYKFLKERGAYEEFRKEIKRQVKKYFTNRERYYISMGYIPKHYLLRNPLDGLLVWRMTDKGYDYWRRLNADFLDYRLRKNH